jgi:hypothetical protein
LVLAGVFFRLCSRKSGLSDNWLRMSTFGVYQCGASDSDIWRHFQNISVNRSPSRWQGPGDFPVRLSATFPGHNEWFSSLPNSPNWTLRINKRWCKSFKVCSLSNFAHDDCEQTDSNETSSCCFEAYSCVLRGVYRVLGFGDSEMRFRHIAYRSILAVVVNEMRKLWLRMMRSFPGIAD